MRNRPLNRFLRAVLLGGIALASAHAQPDLPCLRVAGSGRFLVAESPASSPGTPFFWLGDTAWDLFARLTGDEARHYFDNRVRQSSRFCLMKSMARSVSTSVM
jgi:hypothetical protein